MQNQNVILMINETSSFFQGVATDTSTGFSMVTATMSPDTARRFVVGSNDYANAVQTLTSSGLTFEEQLS